VGGARDIGLWQCGRCFELHDLIEVFQNVAFIA